MNYDEDFIKKIVNLGTLQYGINQAINILDISEKDQEQFVTDWSNPESVIGKAYQKGVDKSQYVIDMKLFKMASEGDLKALQKFEERQSFQKRNK